MMTTAFAFSRGIMGNCFALLTAIWRRSLWHADESAWRFPSMHGLTSQVAISMSLDVGYMFRDCSSGGPLACSRVVLLLVCLFVQTDGPQNLFAQSSESEESVAEANLADRVALLIKQLGHPSYRTRTKAEWSLQQLGLAAYEQLRAAVRDPDTPVEIATAAEYLIESQDVVWYLDTDSVEVRGYLSGYDRLSERERVTRVKILGTHGTPDAVLALCRLMRYERYERVSKEAALSFIEHFTNSEETLPEGLLVSIQQALGPRSRTAVEWGKQVVKDLAEEQQVDVDAWMQFTKTELSLPKPKGRQQEAMQKQLAIDLVTRACAWLTKFGSKESTIKLAKPSIDLLATQPERLGALATMILDEWKVPELVIELANKNEESFVLDTELGYLVAEAYRKMGEEEKAQEKAAEASMRISNPPEQVQKMMRERQIRRPDLIASHRSSVAAALTLRSMFDWAENEYQLAVDELIEAAKKAKEEGEEPKPGTLSAGSASLRDRYEWRIRERFAEFHWFGGKNQEAADLLLPLLVKIEEEERRAAELAKEEKDSEKKRRTLAMISRMDQNVRVRGNFHFYQGLAHIDARKPAEAREQLKLALKQNPTNPDVIIAMRLVTDGDEPFKKFYDEKFSAMRETFRSLVAQEEEANAKSTRGRERTLESNLAHYCNQLAWLLGKCESDSAEALRLSLRSLELAPDQPAYLDTLARCYFSAGQVDKAIEAQKKAIKIAPYERMMVAQLDEFERAKSKSKVAPTP